MTELRDYEAWHRHYDDPGSSLSWRLRQVQAYLSQDLDARSGPLRVLSVCSGDGRDVIEVLAGRSDASRVEVVLIEINREIVGQARASATDAGLDQIEIRRADAGDTDSYEGAVPADIVLLVGIMGNISRDDIDRLVDAAPQFCNPGALVLWSRGVADDADRAVNTEVRERFGACAFTEIGYEEQDGAAIGGVRYEGPLLDLVPGQQLFTFIR